MAPEGAEKPTARFRRVVLKVSGDCFQEGGGLGIDLERVDALARELKGVVEAGVQLCVVVGGGNILRGKRLAERGLGRSSSDYMGMLATVFNALALEDRLEALGVEARILSGLGVEKVAEPFTERGAISHLEKGRVVIFAGGTGNPYFTTDTAAALRALQVGAEALLKGTNVEGVYDKDPREHANAQLLPRVDFDTALSRGLSVMDSTAFSLCRDNNLPVFIFNAEKDPGNIRRVVFGEKVGSTVGGAQDA